MKDRDLILDFINTEAGRFLVGEKGKERIVDVSPDSYSKFLGFNKGKPVLKGVFFAGLGKHIEKIFSPIILKQRIASKKYLDRILQNKYKSFLHFAGLEKSSYLPQVYLDSAPFSPSGNSDGQLDSANNPNVTWATVHDDTSGTFASVDKQVNANIAGSSYTITRWGHQYNTSSLEAGATVIAPCTSRIYVASTAYSNADTTDLDLVATTPATAGTFVGNDFNDFGTTVFATIALASLIQDANNTWTLDANGRANVSVTGWSMFGLRNSRDTDNSAPTAGTNRVQLQESGDANPPVLTVTYTPAPSTNQEIAYFL